MERQPTVGCHDKAAGSDAPHAEWKPHFNTVMCIIGVLNPQSGKVVWTLVGKVTTSALVSFYRKVAATYPQAERIWVAQDNCPVYLHLDVLAALHPQKQIFPVYFSLSWTSEAKANPCVQRLLPNVPLPIQIVQLPTYAS